MNRSAIRELAFKLIYSQEIQKDEDIDEQIELYLESNEITNENEFLLIAKNIIKEIENTFVKDGIPYLDTSHRIIDSFDDDKPNPVGLYLYLINKYGLQLNMQADKQLIAYAEDRAARFPTGHPTMIRALELINK